MGVGRQVRLERPEDASEILWCTWNVHPTKSLTIQLASCLLRASSNATSHKLTLNTYMNLIAYQPRAIFIAYCIRAFHSVNGITIHRIPQSESIKYSAYAKVNESWPIDKLYLEQVK